MTESSGSLTGQRLGAYRLDTLLGSGGMAEVYRATDLSLGREVAVKILPEAMSSDPGYVARFRTEARRVGALNHPNIVPVYNYGEQRGQLYLVMPVLKESLRDVLRREHRLAPARAVEITSQIASALHAAHAKGLIHRDVKPENILVDNTGNALLTDFGIARTVSPVRGNAGSGNAQTLAATGLPVGTPEYMAPEQLRGEPVDAPVDVYALGCVLYELLTGTVPHEAGTPYEVAALVLTAPVVPPSALAPDVTPALESVVLRAMARHATQRFQSADELAEALRVAMLPGASPQYAPVYEVGPTPLLWQPSSAPVTWTGHPDAPTYGADGIPHAQAWGTPTYVPSRRHRRRRSLQLGAAALALVLVAVAGALVLARGNGPGRGNFPAFPVFAHGTISTPGANGALPRSAATATSIARQNATPADGTPALTPGATTVADAAPTATPSPSPTPQGPSLSLDPSSTLELSIHYVGTTRTCMATQTVTNVGPATVGWKWINGAGSYFRYQVSSGNQPPSTPATTTLPADWSPGLAPGSWDTVTVVYTNVRSCQSFPSRTITMQDTTGTSYTFTVQPAQP